MRASVLVAFVVTASSVVWAQAPARPAPSTAAPAAVPRAADGKPDLTGVWQGGSNRPGAWEDANNGLGVGGSGKTLPE